MVQINGYIEELMIDVDQAIDNNEPKRARDMLEEILSIEPSYSIAHNYLGWLYMYYLKNYDLAESHLRLAIKFSPAYPAAFQHLGKLMVWRNKPDEARLILEKGLEYEGIYRPAVYEELGTIYEMKGKYLLARKYYKLAIKNCIDNNYLATLRANLKRCRIKMFLF